MCPSLNAALGPAELHDGAVLLCDHNRCVPIFTTSGTSTSSLLCSHMTSQLRKDRLLFRSLAPCSVGSLHCTYRDEVVLPAPFAVHVVLRSNLIRFVHTLAAFQSVHGNLLVAIAQILVRTLLTWTLFIVVRLGTPPAAPIQTRKASWI